MRQHITIRIPIPEHPFSHRGTEMQFEVTLKTLTPFTHSFASDRGMDLIERAMGAAAEAATQVLNTFGNRWVSSDDTYAEGHDLWDLRVPDGKAESHVK